MKKLLIAVMFSIYAISVSAEMITGGRWGSYWRMTPWRIETMMLQDPAGITIDSPNYGGTMIPNITVNSVMLNIADFQGNILQEAADCPNTTAGKERPSHCWPYTNATKWKIQTFLKNFSVTSKMMPAAAGIDFQALSTGLQGFKPPYEDMNADVVSDDNLIAGENGKLLTMNRLPDKSIMGIMKTYGGDAPSYYFFRLKITDSTILMQQADLAPYATLYQGDVLNEKAFDAALVKATKANWKFRTADFQKRYNAVWQYFTKQDMALTKTYPKSMLSTFYKIDSNFVKFKSTQVGDPQWIQTDFDPKTIEVFGNGYFGTDKYGAFSESTRIAGTDGTYYALSDDDVYWARMGDSQVYTYSRNWGKMLPLANASIATIKFQFKNMEDRDSLCIPKDTGGSLFYTAYDAVNCYGKPANQDGAEIIGTRKK